MSFDAVALSDITMDIYSHAQDKATRKAGDVLITEEQVDPKTAQGILRHASVSGGMHEGPPVPCTLLIHWPHLTEGGPVPLDLLLATSNDPEPEYPRVQQIADAWNREPHNERRGEYFHRNRENGIPTFQDDAIEELLR